MQRIKAGGWLAAGVLVGAAGLAWAGNAGNKAVTRDCGDEPVCKILVRASKGAGNECNVDVPYDVHFKAAKTTKLHWNLRRVNNKISFRFAPGGNGIVINGNSGDYVRDGSSSSGDEVHSVLKRAKKTHLYAVQLEWKEEAEDDSAYQPCNLLDPRINNDG